jgi:hypothetical protein
VNLNKHLLTAAIQREIGWMRLRAYRERRIKELQDATAKLDEMLAEAERRANVWWRRLLRWLGVRRGR